MGARTFDRWCVGSAFVILVHQVTRVVWLLVPVWDVYPPALPRGWVHASVYIGRLGELLMIGGLLEQHPTKGRRGCARGRAATGAAQK